MFSKLLIANRGEIACRVIRTARCATAGVVALGSAACASSGEEPPPPRTPITAPSSPIRSTTMPLDQALAVFRRTCIDTFPDLDAFDRAVAALDIGFVRTGDATPGRRQWREGERYLTLDTAAGEQDCSFRVAIQEHLTRGELVARLGEALAPERAVTDRSFFAFWVLDDGGCRIEYLPASDDLRKFTVMLRGSDDGGTC